MYFLYCILKWTRMPTHKAESFLFHSRGNLNSISNNAVSAWHAVNGPRRRQQFGLYGFYGALTFFGYGKRSTHKVSPATVCSSAGDKSCLGFLPLIRIGGTICIQKVMERWWRGSLERMSCVFCVWVESITCTSRGKWERSDHPQTGWNHSWAESV